MTRSDSALPAKHTPKHKQSNGRQPSTREKQNKTKQTAEKNETSQPGEAVSRRWYSKYRSGHQRLGRTSAQISSQPLAHQTTTRYDYDTMGREKSVHNKKK